MLLAGAAAVWFWVRMPEGDLIWEGGVWHGPDDMLVHDAPVVRLDGQRWMLVQLRPNPPDARSLSRWLWLEATADPPAWAALRHALFARAQRGSTDAGVVHD